MKNITKKGLTTAMVASAVLLAMVPSMVSAAASNMGFDQAGTINVEGSTTVNPIMLLDATTCNPSGYTINVLANDSGSGRQAAIAHWADMAMSSSKASTTAGSGVYTLVNDVLTFTNPGTGASQSDLLTPTAIAFDGVVIIANSTVPADVTQLTKAQIDGIWAGTYTNWNQVGSATSMPIVAWAREVGSGTRQTMIDTAGVVDASEQSFITNRVTSNPDMQAKINLPTSTGAIGYVGLGFDAGANIRALKVVDFAHPTGGTGSIAYSATPQNVYSFTYPISRNLWVYVPKDATGSANAAAIQTFIGNMTQMDGVGQTNVVSAGFLKLIPDADVKGDHSVDVLDLIHIGNHVGETGTARWIRDDVKADGVINVLDLIAVGSWIGTTY